MSPASAAACTLAAMKRASPPLWLVADWFAWLLLMLRFSLLHAVFLICANRAVKRRTAPADLELIAPLLAETEADVAWVIARRVRKLCGLSGNPERIVQRLPATQGAFVRRYRQVNLEINRRVARRMARLAVRRPCRAGVETHAVQQPSNVIAFPAQPRPALAAAFPARAPPLTPSPKRAA